MYMHLIYVQLILKLLLCLHGKYISLSFSFKKNYCHLCTASHQGSITKSSVVLL